MLIVDCGLQALEMGAVGVISQIELEGADVPVIVVPDSDDALSRLAEAFYNFPSKKMTVVGITGAPSPSLHASL